MHNYHDKREQKIKWEEQNLAPWAYLSKYAAERLHPEADDDYRTRFQRDRDRVLTSTYFRQLSDKTQVYVYFHSDIFRRRLTHTLEVHRLAITLSDYLFTNNDLVSAIAYGHDLGHVPFGHAGENAIKNNTSLTNFNHTEQGLRVIDFLVDDYYETKSIFGLNLTNEVRESILKHSGIRSRIFDKYKDRKIMPSEVPPIEGQIVQMADLIASLISDFEDAVNARIIDVEYIKEEMDFIKEYIKIYSKNTIEQGTIKNLYEFRSKLTWALMQDVILTSLEMLQCIFGGYYESFMQNKKRPDISSDDVNHLVRYKAGRIRVDDGKYIQGWDDPNIVHLSKMGCKIADKMWELRKEKIWNSTLVERMNRKAYHVVSELITIFKDNPKLMYHNNMPYNKKYLQEKYKNTNEKIDYYETIKIKNNDSLDRIVVDYIASLSDMTAIDDYKRLTDPSRRSIVW